MSEADTAETGAIVVPDAVETEVKTEAVQEGEVVSESTPEETEEHKHKRKDNVQKRINELTAEKWAEKREKEELKQKLAYLEQQVYQPNTAQEAPTLEQFNYDTDAYQKAVYQYAQAESQRESQRYFEEQRQRETQYREQRRFEDLMQEHGKREEKFAKATPDYREAVDYLSQNMRFGREVVEIIGESSHSPEILYHLATHFDEAVSLADMPPHRAAMQIVRLEAKLAQKQYKPVTKAPAPAPTLNGTTETKKSLETMTTAERIKYWNELDQAGKK